MAGTNCGVASRITTRSPPRSRSTATTGWCAVIRPARPGLPFFPLRSYAGSDLPELNPRIRLTTDPYTGDSVYVVP